MKLIALTGGIASGKSTIGRRFAELGAVLIDADQLAREAVAAGSPGLERVLERFGAGLVLRDGSLDRSALGALVFEDPDALEALNAIVHPEVRRLFRDRIAVVREADPDAVVVYEIPLLVEAGESRSGGADEWDAVIVADAPVEDRVSRMMTSRGMSEQEARARLANQASDAERRAIADYVIDTSRTREETFAQVDALWERLRASDD